MERGQHSGSPGAGGGTGPPGQFVEGCPGEVYVFDAETLRYRHVSSNARLNLGYGLEELRALTPLDLAPDLVESSLRTALVGLARGDEPGATLETVHRRKDGTCYPVRLRLEGFRIADGRLCIALGEELDEGGASRRERARQADTLAGLARLSGEIAHGFNNVLTAILGYSELVAAQLEGESAGLHDDVAELRSAARRAQDMTQQLLVFAGRQVLRPRAVDLDELVESVTKRLSSTLGADVEILLEPTPDLGQVDVDPEQVESALFELAVNARDAMPAGGKLTVATTEVELTPELPSGHPGAAPGPHVVISVADRGTGIPAAVLPRIFEPYFTTKKGAATGKEAGPKGIGLALVHGIVTQHGGHVRVKSELGVGTTFELYFPSGGA